MAIYVYNIIVIETTWRLERMKKIVKSIEPVVIAASGVDEQAIAQANLSEEKNIQQLLGESNETEDSV